MGYIVTAGYATVETAVPGGRARVDIPRGERLPDDVPREDIERCLATGAVSAELAGDDDEVPGGTIADILDWVGDDPDRAARALAVEEETTARSTLMAKLRAIAED